MNLPISENRRPPGPVEPVALDIDRNTLQALQSMQRTFGNFVAVTKQNGRQAIFINDAAEVRQMLVKHHSKYRKGPGFERVKLLLGNGLIVTDGAIWRRSRTMIQPAFSRQNVHKLIELMVSCCRSKEERWEKIVADKGQLNITREMSDFGLELILRATFGLDYETSIMRSGKNPFAFLSEDSTRDLRVVLKLREVRELVLSIIASRRDRAVDDRYDFLATYMAATDKKGVSFSDKELLDELMTLIVAGYETSAGTLNWAWYLLARHPEAQKTLLREALKSIPSAGDVSHESVSSMSYAQALLEETLRLYPPVWLFSRRADQDDSLADYDIPAGTDIYLSPYILHRSDEYWPDPDRFDPERFGPDSPYKAGARPYFPFSLGPRRCLGEYFSFLEMKIHLGLLVQKFHMTLVNKEQPELDFGINLRTKNDIFLRPTLRRNN